MMAFSLVSKQLQKTYLTLMRLRRLTRRCYIRGYSRGHVIANNKHRRTLHTMAQNSRECISNYSERLNQSSSSMSSPHYWRTSLFGRIWNSVQRYQRSLLDFLLFRIWHFNWQFKRPNCMIRVFLHTVLSSALRGVNTEPSISAAWPNPSSPTFAFRYFTYTPSKTHAYLHRMSSSFFPSFSTFPSLSSKVL